MGEWKMSDKFPAEAKLRKDGRIDLRIGVRHLLITKREADCILSDLQVIYFQTIVEEGADE